MRKAVSIWLGIFGACLAVPARADVVKLAELEASALARRPELAASEARVGQAKAQIDQAESAYLPTLSLGADAVLSPGRQLIDLKEYVPNLEESFLVAGSQTVDQTGAFVPQPRYGASLNARGNLYDFGRTGSSVTAANARKRASEADTRARADALVREVRMAYVRWALAHALWQLAEEARASAESQQARTRGLIAEGAAAASTETAARAQTNVATMDAVRAALELDSARLELAFMAVRNLEPAAVPDPELLGAGPPSAANAAESNARLVALEQAKHAAQTRVQMQSQLAAPVLSYRASAGVEARTTSGIDGVQTKVFPNYGFGVSLAIPLWDGGGNAAGEARARAEVAELNAEAAAERARSRHLLALRNAHSLHAARMLELAQQALALAEARLQQLEGGSTLGNAEQQALVAARAERMRARADLARAQAACAQLRLGLI